MTSLNTCLGRYELLCCLGRMCACLQCLLFCLLVKRYLHMVRICIHKVGRMLRSVPLFLAVTAGVYIACVSSIYLLAGNKELNLP
jgi:hypothetical protein